jgi:hypothetical protein
MSDIATEIKPQDVTAPQTDPVKPEEVPLPHVLRHIAEDARKDPALYLDETAVPRGGE